MFREVIGLPVAGFGLFLRNWIGVICRNVMGHNSALPDLIARRRQDMRMAKVFQPLKRLSLISVATFVTFGSEDVQRRNQCIEKARGVGRPFGHKMCRLRHVTQSEELAGDNHWWFTSDVGSPLSISSSA